MRLKKTTARLPEKKLWLLFQLSMSTGRSVAELIRMGIDLVVKKRGSE